MPDEALALSEGEDWQAKALALADALEAAERRAREVAHGLRALADQSDVGHILLALANRIEPNEDPG